MKGIHAFSSLLAGRGDGPSTDPGRSYAPSPSRPGGAGGRKENGAGINAISALLTVALLQRGSPSKRSGPS